MNTQQKTEIKHTAGPWTVDHNHPDDEGTATIHGLDGRYIAHTSDVDSHLIASAPQLLEALKALQSYIIKNENRFEDNDSIWSLIEDSQEAIAAATQDKGKAV